MARRKVPSKLSSARAYWRIASKFRRAGQFRQADHYLAVGDRFYNSYVRDQEYIQRMKEGKDNG